MPFLHSLPLASNGNITLRRSLLALILFSSIASASTVYSPEAGSCQLIGDSDIYGIGIRISYYLQWASIVIALLFCPPKLKSAYAGANIVTFAISINFYNGLKTNPNTVVAVDWNLFTVMTMGLFFITIVPTVYYFIIVQDSMTLIAGAGILWSPLLVGMPWVMFAGYKHGRRDGCDFQLALAGSRNSIYSRGFVITYKVFSICAVPLGALAFLLGVYLLISEWRMSDHDRKARAHSIRNKIRDNDLAPGYLEFIVAVLEVAVGCIVIAVVEKTIAVNNIDMTKAGLTSTGQLIPLVIGLANFGGVCWESARSFRMTYRQIRSQEPPRRREQRERRRVRGFQRVEMDVEEDLEGLVRS